MFPETDRPHVGRDKLDQLIVCPTGEIMVGGNDLTNSYYAQLRPDGTELISQVDRGVIAGITHDPVSGSCVASLYNPETSQGKIVKFSRQGHRMYERTRPPATLRYASTATGTC